MEDDYVNFKDSFIEFWNGFFMKNAKKSTSFLSEWIFLQFSLAEVIQSPISLADSDLQNPD